MNKAKYNYVAQIEKKKYKNFDSIFESDEFNRIPEEDRRKTFYYFALKFASLPNKNITELLYDFETILKKIKTEEFLQKYNEDVYIFIINKYLEKIEVFNASIEFYKDKKNINEIKNIIKCFEKYIKNNNCPKQVFESLKDLYDIIIIKKNHKIPKESLKMIDRHLEKYKEVLDFLNKKFNFGIEINKEEKQREKENDKRLNVQNNKENFNEKNINNNKIDNKNNSNDKNIDNKISMLNNINKSNSDNIYLKKNSNNSKENISIKKYENNQFKELNNINNKNSINEIDFNNVVNINNNQNNNNYFTINNKIIKDINNISLNNESNNSHISSNNSQNNIYVPENLDFAKNLIEGIKNKNEIKSSIVNDNKMQEIKEKKKEDEKPYTNEIHDNSSNKINIDVNSNPFQKKKEQEEIKQKEENSQKNKNKKKEKKKEKRKKIQEKIDEYMAYTKNINIDDI